MMTRLVVIPLAALFATPLGMPAVSAAGTSRATDVVSVIRQRQQTIDRSLTSYKTIKKELRGFSAEGGDLTAYLDGKTIRKITATYLGETGRALEHYYYWEGELQFVYRKDDRYDAPMTGKVVRTAESRFYFHRGKLIQWRDDAGKARSGGGAEFSEKQREYLSYATLFLKGAASADTAVESPD